MATRIDVEIRLVLALLARGYAGATCLPQSEGSDTLVLTYEIEGRLITERGKAGQLRDHVVALPRRSVPRTIERIPRMKGTGG